MARLLVVVHAACVFASCSCWFCHKEIEGRNDTMAHKVERLFLDRLLQRDNDSHKTAIVNASNIPWSVWLQPFKQWNKWNGSSSNVFTLYLLSGTFDSVGSRRSHTISCTKLMLDLCLCIQSLHEQNGDFEYTLKSCITNICSSKRTAFTSCANVSREAHCRLAVCKTYEFEAFCFGSFWSAGFQWLAFKTEMTLSKEQKVLKWACYLLQEAFRVFCIRDHVTNSVQNAYT